MINSSHQNTVKGRDFPELKIDPMYATADDLKPQFVHLEDDLYYQFIPFKYYHIVYDHIVYLGKQGDNYYAVYTSENISGDREQDITIARDKWAAKRATLA